MQLQTTWEEQTSRFDVAPLGRPTPEPPPPLLPPPLVATQGSRQMLRVLR